MRRLPGPADCRLSEGVHGSRGSLRIVLGLAENTNSIFCDGSHEPETANGCPVLRRAGATRREAYTRRMNPEAASCAVSRPRPIHLRLPLTTDLHGCRPSGTFVAAWPQSARSRERFLTESIHTANKGVPKSSTKADYSASPKT